jgi:hypothetical protein
MKATREMWNEVDDETRWEKSFLAKEEDRKTLIRLNTLLKILETSLTPEDTIREEFNQALLREMLVWKVDQEARKWREQSDRDWTIITKHSKQFGSFTPKSFYDYADLTLERSGILYGEISRVREVKHPEKIRTIVEELGKESFNHVSLVLTHFQTYKGQPLSILPAFLSEPFSVSPSPKEDVIVRNLNREKSHFRMIELLNKLLLDKFSLKDVRNAFLARYQERYLAQRREHLPARLLNQSQSGPELRLYCDFLQLQCAEAERTLKQFIEKQIGSLRTLWYAVEEATTDLPLYKLSEYLVWYEDRCEKRE